MVKSSLKGTGYCRVTDGWVDLEILPKSTGVRVTEKVD